MKVSTTSSSVLLMVMTGGDSAPRTRMLVFLRLIVSPNSLQAWDSLSTRCWRPSSLWHVKASLWHVKAWVLARSLAMLKSLPSQLRPRPDVDTFCTVYKGILEQHREENPCPGERR